MRILWLFPAVGLVSACEGDEGPPALGASPPVEVVEVAPSVAPVANLAAPGPAERQFPRRTWPALPVGEWSPPAGTRVLAFSPDSTSGRVWLATGAAEAGGTWALSAWVPGKVPEAVVLPELGLSTVSGLASSPFDGGIYLTGQSGDQGVVVRCEAPKEGLRLETCARVWGGGPVNAPVVPLVTYREPSGKEQERVYFGEQLEGGGQITWSVRADGSGAYNLSAPNGALDPRSDPAILAMAPAPKPGEDPWERSGERAQPRVQRLSSAGPLGVDPNDGTLWLDTGGSVAELSYEVLGGNWAAALEARGTGLARPSPNGALRLRCRGGRFALEGRGLSEEASFKAPFTDCPQFSWTGDGLVGRTETGLVVISLDHPRAPIRFLGRFQPANDDDVAAAMVKKGMAYPELGQGSANFYAFYEYNSYSEGDYRTIPLATIDPMLDVLHAGFQAVFVTAERERSRPALEKFLSLLQPAAQAAGQAELAEVAGLVGRMLQGDYEHEEGQRVRAGARVQSPLYGKEVDYADWKPRGPYATDPDLSNYFVAFKAINEFQFSDALAESLAGNSELVAAWKAWTGVQGAFLSGARSRGLFEGGMRAAPWMKTVCVPESVRERGPRAFPLAWGLDSEVMHRTTAHDEFEDKEPNCTVPRRGLPSGLDLLVALGSKEAKKAAQQDLATWPTLAERYAELAESADKHLPGEGFQPGWLNMVRTLVREDQAPPGVDPTMWRRRLMESGLASWASLRHTLVLVTEVSMAEMGGGGEEAPIFELMSLEPLPVGVDPLPKSWAALGKQVAVLRGLAPEGGAVAKILHEVEGDVAGFGEMAKTQLSGQPLSVEQEERVWAYARAVEHPWVQLKSLAAAGGKAGAAELVLPEPPAKIVDIHHWPREGGVFPCRGG